MGKQRSSIKFTECLVCGKMSKTNYCVLKPCDHSPACEDCSARIKLCLICDKVIERRLTSTSHVVPYRGAATDAGSHVSTESTADGQTLGSHCIVCVKHKKTVDFQCGHGACPSCASLLSICPTCQKTITSKVRHEEPASTSTPSKELQLSINDSAVPSRSIRSSAESFLPSPGQESTENSIHCNVCLERKISVSFSCGHAACSACSKHLSICPFCQQAIVSKIKRAGSSVTVESSAVNRVASNCEEPYRSPAAEKSDVEENRVISLDEEFGEASSRCIVCVNKTITVDFQCGHSACSACASQLYICPACQQIITSRVEHGETNEFTECMVCCQQSTSNYCVLKPCDHKPACEDCSAGMTECLICDVVIDQRLATNNRIVPYRSLAAASADKEVDDLDEEASSRCVICLKKKNTVDFQCGHSACPPCASKLSICHICQKTITSKIKHEESVSMRSKDHLLEYDVDKTSLLKPCGHRSVITPGYADMGECQFCENAIDQLILIDVDESPYNRSPPLEESHENTEPQLPTRSIIDSTENNEDRTSVLEPIKPEPVVKDIMNYPVSEKVTDQIMPTQDSVSPSDSVFEEKCDQTLKTDSREPLKNIEERRSIIDVKSLEKPAATAQLTICEENPRIIVDVAVTAHTPEPNTQDGWFDDIPKYDYHYRIKSKKLCTIL